MASRPTDPGAENTTDPNLDSGLHSCKTRGGTQTPAQSWVGMVGGESFPLTLVGPGTWGATCLPAWIPQGPSSWGEATQSRSTGRGDTGLRDPARSLHSSRQGLVLYMGGRPLLHL